MTTFLRLRRIFRTLTVSSLAATAASCGGSELPYDPADFAESSCGPSLSFDELTDVVPAVPVDFLAQRYTPPYTSGNPPVPVTTLAVGTACATATNPTACQDALATLPTNGWVAGYPYEFSPSVQWVYTRGDTVAAIRTHAELAAFLGSVDSAKEAAMLVVYGEDQTLTYFVDCSNGNARTVEGGFEVLLRSGFACGEGTHLDETRFFVAADGTVTLLDSRVLERGDPHCAIGRLTAGVGRTESPAGSGLGARLGEMASLEAAAIVAFERLARELVALEAPTELVARARRSASDETRHAGRVAAMARARGGTVAPIVVVPTEPRSPLAIAIENAVEGTVRETYGAALATYQADAARDPELARLFRDIAIDETHHAALSLDLARWLETKLTPDERARVRGARDDAARSLLAELGTEPADATAREAMGLPDVSTARAIFAATFPTVWA